MYNFFATENSKTSDGYEITGKDYNHIKNVLRKKAGEDILVTLNGKAICVALPILPIIALSLRL